MGRRRATRWRGFASAAALHVALLALAPLSAGADGEAGSAGDLDARIRELEAAVARDEEAVRRLVSAPPVEGGAPLYDEPELRAIARRLPGQQAELRALREQRARGDSTTGEGG